MATLLDADAPLLNFWSGGSCSWAWDVVRGFDWIALMRVSISVENSTSGLLPGGDGSLLISALRGG